MNSSHVSPRVPRNSYVSNGDGTTLLVITRKSGERIHFLIDDVDVELAQTMRWSVTVTKSGHTYATHARRVKGAPQKTTYLHRLLSGAPASTHIDHVNGSTLNNRRSNLRQASHRQNMRNRRPNRRTQTGLKGVRRDGNRYVAQIGFENKLIYLGRFGTAEEAARCYDSNATRLFGAFARTNY